MIDLVSFLEALATDDYLRQRYEEDPIAFVMGSDLSDEDKTLLTTANNAAAINEAIAEQGGGDRLEVAAANHIKYQVILR